MKKIIITSIGLLFLTTNAFALDPLGPPLATSKGDSLAIAGLEYLYGKMDLHSDSFSLITYPALPALPVSIEFSSANIKDVKTNKFYATLLSEIGDDNFDLFLRLGMSDANPDRNANRDNFASSIGNSDYDIALGGGIRKTFYQSADGKTKWGLLAQLSYANLDFDNKTSIINGYDVSLSAKLKMLEIQIAAGPSYQVSDSLSIYGGPFVSFVKGDINFQGSIDGDSCDGSTKLKQQSKLGGFIGLSKELTKNTNLNAEFQLTGDSQAVGFRFIHRF